MRKSGILLHITSLPGKYGIGTMGREAREFVDFLKKSGQSYWQILPIHPTSYGDSPYASYSTFAGNPYFIDFDLLKDEGLLQKEEYDNINWGDQEDQVDFGILYNQHSHVLRKAVDRFLKNPDREYEEFLQKNADWIDDYALFMALKDRFDGKAWSEWPEEYRHYTKENAKKWREEMSDVVNYYRVIQYFFSRQWNALKKYANDNGVEIIGDLPIYVAMDSVDVWSHPGLFELDEYLVPTEVAGCPPDGFSAVGQLWGNPIYRWDEHKKTGYEWWIRRVDYLTKMYDVLRIDHFRGFDSFYSIPFGETTAINGHWNEGPGMDLFQAITNKVGEKRIIAEDLGLLTDSVKKLLADTGYPGMKLLQFAFDSRDPGATFYAPYNYPKNSIAYTGTHDNNTIQGWFDDILPEDKEYAIEYLQCHNPEDRHWVMIRELLKSPSDTAIITAQDLLGLRSESRMNTPNTVGNNWKWRLKDHQLTDQLADDLFRMNRLYSRNLD